MVVAGKNSRRVVYLKDVLSVIAPLTVVDDKSLAGVSASIRCACRALMRVGFQSESYALALSFVCYNFCRIHKTLRVTPAMSAGPSDTVHDME